MARQPRHDSLAGGFLLRAFLFAFLLLMPRVGYGDDTYSGVSEEVAELLSRGRFDSASQEVIGRLFHEANSDDIPPELLLPRLQEGVSKRAEAAAVIETLRAEITYLTAARDIVSREPDGSLILEDSSNWFRAANFLRSGQSEEALRLVTQACAVRPETFRSATLLYLSISEWGVEEALGRELVEAVVVSNLDPAEYLEVTGLLSDAQRSHMDLADAVRQISQYLRDGRSLRQITRILRR